MHADLTARVKPLGPSSWIAYVAGWMPPAEATALQGALTEQIAWEQRAITMFGQPILQPRLIGWGGDLPYRYSGQTLEPAPVPDALRGVFDAVVDQVAVPFNHVLLNRYRNGQDAMGMHADDEPELGWEPTIAALSLGVRRRFVLESKGAPRRKRTVELAHGSLFLMGGACQHRWYHGVPRQAAVREERINVTFRWLKGPPGWRTPVGP
jgi:alkylated DNA repair dioxygenase AlkB